MLRRLLRNDIEWASWCQWPARGGLLGGALIDPCPPGHEVASLHGFGLSLGVAEAGKVIGTGPVHT